MATLDDDLAKAVTEGFRLAQSSIINQDLILSGTGDVTVTLADGSKKTGPSWSKLIAQAGAAGASAAAAKTSETNAKTSETNANSSKTAAASSASAAKTSETNAKTSETNAKTSETNAKTSENNAAASASSAAASLAAAQLLTSVPYEEAPFPDVWLPLNDDLRLLAGFAPYDRLTISGQVLELPTKSASLTRSTAATYYDKSGVLQYADINEPRFERDGLLIEGQSTNYILNSNDPSKWNTSAAVTKTVLTKDGTSQAPTMKGVLNAVQNFPTFNVSSDLTLEVGDMVAISCRAKGSYGYIRVVLQMGANTQYALAVDAITGVPLSPPAGATLVTSLGGDGYISIFATMPAKVAGVHTSRIMAQPAAGDTVIPVNAEFYVQMPQLEKNAVPTSYIPTVSAPVTRTGDQLNLQTQGNVGYNRLGDIFARTLALEFTVDQFVQPTSGAAYVDFLANVGARNDIIIRGVANQLISYRSSGGIAIPNVAYPFNKKTYVQTVDVANNNTVTGYFDGKSTTRAGNAPTDASSSSTSIRFNSNSFAVYHIRNFRIWHRVLTPNQINGLR
ncbi:LamG domain-containing protein [Leclercia adecarboxylata]|uniref:LamG domain-containing protein n=1 Tax=Leclercia adecarboxylata TaxID=83655 RepID=UPI0021E902B6|nr:LamG domain-containing protein [Leclercia adecarboxylata]MCV3301684.1 LamG domain-containing protein [Leclercia adecarboxylata]MCV3306322.1 LamG domain-containing protein [Leclercia adecarboxylata]